MRYDSYASFFIFFALYTPDNVQQNGIKSGVRTLAFISKGSTSFYGHYQTLTRLLYAIHPSHCRTQPITPHFLPFHHPIFSFASISPPIQPSHQEIIHFFNQLSHQINLLPTGRPVEW